MGGLRSWRYTEAPHREKGSGTVLTQRSRFCGLESQQRFLTPLPGSGFRPAIGTLRAYPNAVMLVTLETKAPWANRSRSDFTLLSPSGKPIMNQLYLTLTIFLAASLCATHVPAQDAAPADRNAVNTAARPGGMMADSPVTFPKQGALPAKYPPDVKDQRRAVGEGLLHLQHALPLAGADRGDSDGHAVRPVHEAARGLDASAAHAPHPHRRRRPAAARAGRQHRERHHALRLGGALQEAYPKARIQATVFVRGGGGCQHYREEGRVEKYILPWKPDLVFIGGISQKTSRASAK